MPAADYQRIVVILRAPAQNDAGFAVRPSFPAFRCLYDRDQGGAVDPHKRAREFCLQRFQRIVDQRLSLVEP